MQLSAPEQSNYHGSPRSDARCDRGGGVYLHNDRLSNDVRQREQSDEDLRQHQEYERLKSGADALQKFSQQRATTVP